MSSKGPAEPFKKLLPQSWVGWFVAIVLGVVTVTHPAEAWHATSTAVWGAGRWVGYQAFATCDTPPPYHWMSPKHCPTNPDGPGADQPTTGQVGRYALKGRLGVGGLGQVHEAWDPLLSRTVAIKTLQFESDPRTRNSLDRLFLNEARAVAGLSHPNIVTVYDAGLSPSGVYLAMERLQGKDLRQRLSEGWKPGPAVVAQLVRRVADALAYAHARGVVHCDVKPGNIFITGSDKPKVLDFGIARVAHGLRLDPHQIKAHQWLVNGPQWLGLLLDSAESVLAVQPDYSAVTGLDIGLIGPHATGHDCAFEVRAFAYGDGPVEDPVTGSLNAGLAQWLIRDHLAPESYVAAQGTALGRAGRVHVERQAGRIWIGGHSVTVIEGQVNL